MRYRIYIVMGASIICLALMITSLAEREVPTVIKHGSQYVKLEISLSDLDVAGEQGKTFKQTLSNDLKMSGWFTVVDGEGVIVVSGEGSEAGGAFRVKCDVTRKSDDKRYMARTCDAPTRDVRRLAHKVADEIVWNVKRVKGIASTRIVMVGSVGGQKDIYMCDADGANLERWTRDGAVCLSPNWRPDSSGVVFTSFRSDYPDVYSIDIADRKMKKLVGYPGLNMGADVSPDGKKIVLTLSKDGNPELYVMTLATGKLRRLTNTRTASEASPSWSPDGKNIVYVTDTTRTPQLYVIPSKGGRPKRISLRGRENVAPDWGQNGLITYSSRRDGRYHVCVIDPDTGRESCLTKDAADHEDPSWAPDGRHIVCSHTIGYQSKVYILDTLGDPSIQLTHQKGDWYSPAWSPN